MGNIGYRVINDFQRIESNVIEGYKGIATPVIGDVMGKMWVMNHLIKSINSPGIHVVGSALTVRTHPSDNLMVHKAMDLAKPGDIIVIDASGDTQHAILGEIMCHYARSRGIAGFVVDGAVRDRLSISNMGFPVFSKGVTPRGPYKEGPGEVNTVISCGNVPVSPGDIIVGDDDGVAVIPKADAELVLTKSNILLRQEEEIVQKIDQGQWDRRWVDQTLEAKGIEIKQKV
ncbi:RraA family protein [Peribacillus saganii]|uniref:Putative 4-hydroxy-4-methyl-2-oxoglutarate aldolase n=1 Tax=Peribacillus saganii TaxID=2303992 RepID=A0A372LAN0_9BACI|nr:RraA family protein [Peribacillus saganii]RFU62806.1 RraA family protein [Peribacillus saganii]